MALIDLLEGRIDGDAMFFSREIEITGSTAVIVAVRNTLDREEIVITDEIAAMFGPLERPARRIALRVDTAIGRARARIATIHARLHEADRSGARPRRRMRRVAGGSQGAEDARCQIRCQTDADG